jgi:hypothetical protein
MKHHSLLILSLVLAYSVQAQIIIMQDPVSARTFNGDKYSGMKGSPFLYDKWLPGAVTTPKGIYPNLELKLDAYSNLVYHKKNDEPYEIQDEIKSFYLLASDTLHFKKGLSGKTLAPGQFVQVLAEGKVSFYRSDIKLISEMSEINSGMIKTFIAATRYFIVKDGQTILVRLNKNDIIEYLGDQQEKVKAFIEENRIAGKKEVEISRIIDFYNTL